MNSRNRTPSEYVGYGLYLYFSGLSLRRTAERISYFVRRNHVSIWNWIQKYNPRKISVRRRKISGYIIDETLVKVGSESIWLWVAIDRVQNQENSSPKHVKREKHACVRERDLLLMWSRLMENIQFQLMVVEPGTLLKHVDS